MPNNAQNLESTFDKNAQSVKPPQSAASLENKRSGASVAVQVSLENKGYHSALADVPLEVDCHAATNAATRNDDKTATSQSAASLEKVDSGGNAQNLTTPQAAGFCDDFGGFQGGGEGIYLSGNEQAPAAESPKSAQKPTPIAIAFLSVLYSGRSPKAPGTAGSALSVLLGLPILLYSAQTLFLLACLLGIIAVREIDKWEAYSGKHDEKWIVIDELVGVWLAMAIIGAVAGCSVSLMILAFGTFRLFDIWKPSIIGRVDRKLKGGLGVVLDDVLAGLVAGVFSLVVLAILSRFGVDLSLW